MPPAGYPAFLQYLQSGRVSDFLGQNVRRYRCGKVLTKPSSQNVKTFLSKIRETIDNSGSLTAGVMIQRLNQQIKGWTMYHRYAASKRTFM